MDRPEIRRFKEGCEIASVVPDGAAPRLTDGAPVTPAIVREKLETTPEPANHTVPTAMVGPRPVDEDRRVARIPHAPVEDLSVRDSSDAHP